MVNDAAYERLKVSAQLGLWAAIAVAVVWMLPDRVRPAALTFLGVTAAAWAFDWYTEQQ